MNVADSDSGSDCDDDDLPLNTDESSSIGKEEDNGPAAKRAARLWGDVLMEQSLLNRGSGITLEKPMDDNRIIRGVESYHIPKSFTSSANMEFDSSGKSVHCDEAFASTDDPFGDPAVDLSAETALCERLSEKNCCSSSGSIARKAFKRKGSHVPPGRHGRGPRGRRCDNVNSGYRGRHYAGIKRSWQGKAKDRDVLAKDREVLLSPSYSLETLMAVEFASNISIEELGHEMAKAMGERNVKMVQKIVRVCGMDKALSLFEETRKIESTGGMMIENGMRRRTPGGVFISLFKLDSDISEDEKKQIFDESKKEIRRSIRAKKGRFNFAENVTELRELMKKQKKGDGETNSLKPLPSAEILLQKGAIHNVELNDADEDKRASDNEKRENIEMDL